MRYSRFVLISVVCALSAATGAQAQVPQTLKKAIWGPVERNGVSQFPIYRDLGVGIYQIAVKWSAAAPVRPANPRNPADPAYRWPADLDGIIAEAAIYNIRVLLQLRDSPAWANGGHDTRWAPRNPKDFADFAVAAARRYPAVHHWMIWGEPTRGANFQPLRSVPRRGRLTTKQSAPARTYARLLDASYAALKGVSKGNLVIGGNTFTSGVFAPLQWIRYLRLPNGRPPRMDLYGHNPFTGREPDLRKKPLDYGVADFSDLDTLARAVDRNLGRLPGRKRIRLFLSEWTIPTDRVDTEFNFYVDRDTQARWIRSAFKIVRSWWRIYSLGWVHVYDDPPASPGGVPLSTGGLLDTQGNKKPGYVAFRAG